MVANGGNMKRSGERAVNVSTDTEPQASDNLENCTKTALFYDRLLGNVINYKINTYNYDI